MEVLDDEEGFSERDIVVSFVLFIFNCNSLSEATDGLKKYASRRLKLIFDLWACSSNACHMFCELPMTHG